MNHNAGVVYTPLHYHVSGVLVCSRACVLYIGRGTATPRSPWPAVTLLCNTQKLNVLQIKCLISEH